MTNVFFTYCTFRSLSVHRPPRGGPRSPPPKSSSSRSMQYHRGGAPPPSSSSASTGGRMPPVRPSSPPPPRNADIDKYQRAEMNVRRISRQRSIDGHVSDGPVKVTRPSRHSPLEDPRLKNRPPEPPEPTPAAVVPAKKKKKEKEVRLIVKHKFLKNH